MNDIKFGDLVSCTGYIKKTKNHYVIEELFCTGYIYAEDGTETIIDVEEESCGDHDCHRYHIKKANFTGIYVGTTIRNIRIEATHHEGPYGERYQCYTKDPCKFAVVYYQPNKKRLVPMTRVKLLENRNENYV